MKILTLIQRNLWYYRKQYLALLAGTVISTAVLTGALTVGDSVRYSLARITEKRLGKTRYALWPEGRFFRNDLAADLEKKLGLPVIPALQLRGMAINSDLDIRLNNVTVTGIDAGFLRLWEGNDPVPGDGEAVITRNISVKLGIRPGDQVLLKIEKPGLAPQNAPFVAERSPAISMRLKVSAIAGDDGFGRFNLKNNQEAPLNIFISGKMMAGKLSMAGYANLLLVEEPGGHQLAPGILDSVLNRVWQPADAGIRIRPLKQPDEFEITSDRIFIDETTGSAILSECPACQPILTYLVNSISYRGESTPYSFVTAADESFLSHQLSPGEVLVNQWLAADLGLKKGDSVRMRYFIMGPYRSLKEDSSSFRVNGIIPVNDPCEDPRLMPDFPGMSDAGKCSEWETGAPIDLKKIRDKDEQYWNDYRGTPKAFISLSDGKKLWNNPFGRYTAFRVRMGPHEMSETGSRIMRKIKPSETGMIFRPVYSEGMAAASNSTDFGQLFLGLSFFIILSGLLLTALLFSLQVTRRQQETGLLQALGFRKRRILGLLIYESSVVALAGSILGAFTGILYNRLILSGLASIWQDAVRTSSLEIRINPMTIVTGTATGFLVSVIVIGLVLIKMLRRPPSVTVKPGLTGISGDIPAKKRIIKGIFLASIILPLVLIIYSMAFKTGINPAISLVSGGLVLVAFLSGFYIFIAFPAGHSGDNVPGFTGIVARNAGRNRARTMSAIALLAIGTFSILVTGMNRRPAGETNSRQSGSGGFLFWAETTLPVLNDLNTTFGKKKYGLQDEEVLKNTRFIQMHRLDGNDASCLNLNQVSAPAIIGVPEMFFDRVNAFGFIRLDPSMDPVHPWRSLGNATSQGVIPGYADETVIRWGLRKNLGDTLLYRDENGSVLRVRLTAGLDNSIFQGNILIADSIFRVHFPSVSGSKLMLIDGPQAESNAIGERMGTLLSDYGIVLIPATEKLAVFNTVQNTYLTVFMMLGGLGIIIGTFGLGIVLVRNILDRKAEIALYLVLGYDHRYVKRLITAEFFFVLVAGILAGTVSAFAGLLPSIISGSTPVPGWFVIFLLALILLIGYVSVIIPVNGIMRSNLVVSLREE
jgi:putative ABC transport system permease protein